VRHLIRGVFAWLLISGVCLLSLEEPGQPVWLRWLRTLSAHPLRGTLALALLSVALCHSSREPPRRAGP
jgi:hypothetical protein